LYNCKFKIRNSRRRIGQEDGSFLMKSPVSETVYQIP
jgi:hypothetical protein